MFPLSSEAIIQELWTSRFGGSLTYWENGLAHLKVVREGLTFDGPVLDTAWLKGALVVLPHPLLNCLDLTGREAEGWLLCQYADDVRAAVMSRDIEKLGRAMDATWGVERRFASLWKNDIAYAQARIAGAFGGRPCEAGLVMVVPPEKRATFGGTNA